MDKRGMELFEAGISFQDFVNLDEDSYKENTLYVYRNINITDSMVRRIENIDKKINVLICAEIWCPDCMINVPVIEKMKQINDNINLSIVGKDNSKNFFNKYTPDEVVKIPTFVFFDESFNEIGSFVERPNYIKEKQNDENEALKLVTMRKYKKGEYTNETLKDILHIIGY